LKSEKLNIIIKALNLLIGFPKNKNTPNNKKYLRGVLLGGRLVLGGRDYICTVPHFWTPKYFILLVII
jgi:hypothetical protein